MKDRGVLVGSLAAAVLASACCLGPLVLGAIGLGSLGAAAALAPLRPWFLLLTAMLLGVGFYFAYRPLRTPNCHPGSACAEPQSRTTQRVVLWIVAVLTVALATYPSWGARLAPRSSSIAAASGTSALVVLEVEGMTCSACAGEIERELNREPGVRGAAVSFEARRATVTLEKKIPVEQLTAAVARAGYRARVATQ